MDTLKRFTALCVFFTGLFLLGSTASFAQVGFDNPNPDASSILDLTSTKRGLLIPRMSTNERTSILNPADGLLVFDNSLNTFFFYSKKHKRWEAINPLVNAGQDTTNIYLETSGKKVGIGKVPATELDVNGTVQANNANITGTAKANKLEGYGTVPMGGIIMWSGNPYDLPDGWALCDGQNSNGIQTPDLSGRFIVGVGAASGPGAGPSYYNAGSQGGEETHTLTTNEMPSHAHSATSDVTGAHQHYVATNSSGTVNVRAGFSLAAHSDEGDYEEYRLRDHPNGANVGNSSTAGWHSHTINVYANGGGQSHENRPPYFALAYIMRVK